MVSAFASAKEKSIKIDVIIAYRNNNENVGQSKTINIYKDLFGDTITFKFLEDIEDENSNRLSKSNNFLTIDENSVRYELSTPDIEACAEEKIRDTEATACFNDTEGQVLKLNNAFDFTFSKIK